MFRAPAAHGGPGETHPRLHPELAPLSPGQGGGGTQGFRGRGQNWASGGWCCPPLDKRRGCLGHQRATGAGWRTDPEPPEVDPTLSLQSLVSLACSRRDAEAALGAFPLSSRLTSPEGQGVTSRSGGPFAGLFPSPWPGSGTSTKCSSKGVQRTKKRIPQVLKSDTEKL